MKPRASNLKSVSTIFCSFFLSLPGAFTIRVLAQTPEPSVVQVDWQQTVAMLKTSATLQVAVNPMLRRGSPIHDAAFRSLQEVGADYVRYALWYTYPKLVVPELQPPTVTGTSWDFRLIDPIADDFFSATQGHSVILDFSTIPAWMFKTNKAVSYPDNPDTVDWNYTQGTELRDPTMRELGDYYARLAAWYTRGGFTDELRKQHNSGHHFKIDYWEVFNEVDLEHKMTPQQYTQRYDAIVTAIHKVNPEIKFVGLALADPGFNPEMFFYFLNHANHRPGIPLDMISYHFYATPTETQTLDDWQYTFFDQADHFLTTVTYVEAIRKRLSPETRTTLDEIGSYLPIDYLPTLDSAQSAKDAKGLIPSAYWNLSGALYAYVYVEVAKLGIDAVGESWLLGFPSQFPSASMLDWSTGNPNARLRVLELLHQSFSPGDEMVGTKIAGTAIAAQAFVTSIGKKLLLVNKRNRDASVTVPDSFDGGKATAVDTTTGAGPPVAKTVSDHQVLLHPFAVCVVSMNK